MAQSIRAWLWAVFAVFILYVGISMLFFNHVGPAIFGMPPIIFWFTLVPLMVPLILGMLYFFDKKHNPQWDLEGEK